MPAAIKHQHTLPENLFLKHNPLLQIDFIPASNEPSDCLQAFGDCREGQIPRPLGRFKFDAPLLAAGFLTFYDAKKSSSINRSSSSAKRVFAHANHDLVYSSGFEGSKDSCI